MRQSLLLLLLLLLLGILLAIGVVVADDDDGKIERAREGWEDKVDANDHRMDYHALQEERAVEYYTSNTEREREMGRG